MADESGLKTLKRGDVINGRYEIVRPLGDGMLGATFLAKHMASDKHVAIKFIHARLVRNPKDRERLEAAFRSAKGVKHDGIIRYGELGNYESTVFFISVAVADAEYASIYIVCALVLVNFTSSRI